MLNRPNPVCAERGSRRSRLSIGIADDDADLRNVLTQFLKLLGHDVVCAVEDGGDLLATSADHEFDLVLVDFDMPFLDGLAVAEELAKTKGIPVIMMSGHSDMQHVVRNNEPIAEYLIKPITIEALDAAIRSATR